MLYSILALLSILFWYHDPASFCSAKACEEIPGLFGRSWYLWGAVYYAAASTLIISNKSKKFITFILLSGILFHIGLIIYGYIQTASICSYCLLFSILEVVFALVYLMSFNEEENRFKKAFTFVSGGFFILVLIILTVNPFPLHKKGKVFEITPIADVKAQENINRSELQPKPKTKTTRYIEASTPEGKIAILDLQERPALFFASWCDHCDEALLEAAEKPQSERPYLVATYGEGNDREEVKDKLAKNRLGGESYYLMPVPPAEVKKVPTIIVIKANGG